MIDQFKKLTSEKSVGVLICSDSTEILQEIKQRYPDFILPKGSVAQDMYALSLCDYILGPQATTMSAWAAYIGNKSIFQIINNLSLTSINDFKKVRLLESFNPV